MQMKNTIYIVTYHYVRNIKNSNYPNLKGLEFEEFKKQINYFKKNFNILKPDIFIKYIKEKRLPKKTSILLTFDDGYKDHYEYVFPYLKKNNLQGCFYPPASIVKQKKILDVNKIQFLMSKEKNRKKILLKIKNILKKKYNFFLDDFLKVNKNKIKNLKSKFDDKETLLIKSLLQKLLPIRKRKFVIDQLFKEIVTNNFKKFSSELYLSLENIKEMIKYGMHFGSHGYNHEWWSKLAKEKQEKEIVKSIKFLKQIGVKKNNLSVCYPFGSFNNHTISILKKYSFKFGLTTSQQEIDLSNIENFLTLPRYDTNYFKNFY